MWKGKLGNRRPDEELDAGEMRPHDYNRARAIAHAPKKKPVPKKEKEKREERNT